LLPNRTVFSPNLVYPRMTYYTRVVDNQTGEQVFPWLSTSRNKNIFYGCVDAINGGESDFIVEYDIYNNEPYAWDGQGASLTAMNAVECNLYIDFSSECRNIGNFFYCRCVTYDPHAEWEAITPAHPKYTKIQGAASPDFGTILGVGDHAVIQTKLMLKKNTTICKEMYNFQLRFSYKYRR